MSRCAHPECRACSMCTSMQTCTPASPSDLKHEACQQWCKGAHATTHCQSCACKSCSFCTSGTIIDVPAPGPPVTCAPSAKDDGKVEACKSYCQDKHASAHCPRCDCKACGFCSAVAIAAKSAASAASAAAAMAAPVLPFTPAVTCLPFNNDDLKFESCAMWCKPEHRSSHCSLCACKTCNFCGGIASPTGGGGQRSPVSSIAAGKACASVSPDDGKVEACKSYCQERHASAHCPRCDCQACGFCSARQVCSPHNAADTSVESCEGFCLETRSKDHCPLCRCKRCSFCQPGGGPGAGAVCTPHDDKDASISSCERFCNVRAPQMLLCSCHAHTCSSHVPDPALTSTNEHTHRDPRYRLS